MKTRHKKLAIAGGVLCAIAAAAALVMNAFQSNLVFFFTPTQVAAGEAPKERTFRIGGLVKPGSLVRNDRPLSKPAEQFLALLHRTPTARAQTHPLGTRQSGA